MAVSFVFFDSKCSLLCTKPFSARKYQLSAKSNDNRSHTPICIHVMLDLPEEMVHSDCLTHVQTLQDKDLHGTEFAIRHIDNPNTTQTPECTQDKYNANIKVKGSLLRSHQQPM
jgi:hypothetical protein